MRSFAALMTLAVLVPGRAAANDAEKLFLALEDQIRAARSLEVHFEAEQPGTKEPSKFLVALRVADGNRLRMEVRLSRGGKEENSLLVCDGKHLKGTGNRLDTQGKAVPAPPKLATLLTRGATRLGLPGYFGPGFDPLDEKLDPDAFAKLDGFRLGAKEKVAGRDAQAIEYQTEIRDRILITLWLDVKTGLPLKRVLRDAHGKELLTEVYREFRLNPPLDATLFALPK